MITNLPKTFPISALDNFDFGDAEARDDKLLAFCPVPTSSMNDFLLGKKDIVLGFRGTGKSAIVRLLLEKKLKFKNEVGWESLLICLDEEFDYRAIREHLHKHADSDRSRLMACRIVWELLIIYRALKAVQEKINNSDSTINEYVKDIEISLGITAMKPKFLEIILSHKKKVGVKFDTSFPNVIDMYAGLEPSLDTKTDVAADTGILKLVEYKKYLDQFLLKRKMTLYVLFDRLDDFVVHEDYETQKTLIQELLATQTDYRQKYQNIKIRSFLRTDLFKKLNLDEFGSDKILARCVELNWSSSELKHLLAKRIAHNLMSIFKLKSLEISIDADQFFVSREELPKLTESKMFLGSNFKIFSFNCWKKLFWLKKLKNRSTSNNDNGRMQNSTDIVHEAIITSIFPHEAIHAKLDGSQTPIDLFNFFETHFQFAHGQATPRVMLSFLDHCVTCVREYYNNNGDISDLEKNDKGEFPLFVKKAMQKAYCDLKKEAWEVQFQWTKKWESYTAIIQELSTQKEISFKEFTVKADASDDDAKQFLAFVTHTGLLRCLNEKYRHENRRYEIPILFQNVSDRTN